jgi:isopenicillin-N N-acyltransferase like protein
MLTRFKVSGTHYECGRQLGAAHAHALRQAVLNNTFHVASGLTWDDYRSAAQPYLAATKQAFPWIIEEMRGAADGSGVDFLDLFTGSIEEIFNTPPELTGRCSDFAACAPATGGHVLLGHNNDLSPATEAHLIAVEWDLPDQPKLFTVGVGGLFPSVGINAAGICLTGNELSPNDERPGIPRLLIARALLAERTFEDALAVALHPDRASSYNNLISSPEGQIVCAEASATDHELLYPEDGWLVHTNHYVHPRMTQYETAPEQMSTSYSRYDRAFELMDTISQPITADTLKTFLGDHDASPVSLCRHGERVKTVFSTVIDLTDRTVDGLVGNPCEGQFERLWSW